MNTARTFDQVNSAVRHLWGRKPAAASLAVKIEGRPQGTILHVQGRLTIEEVGALQGQFEEALRAAVACIVVNLAGCTFADTAGVAALVSARERAGEVGKRFLFVGVSAQVLSVLEMLRLDKVFDTRPSIDDILKN